MTLSVEEKIEIIRKMLACPRSVNDAGIPYYRAKGTCGDPVSYYLEDRIVKILDKHFRLVSIQDLVNILSKGPSNGLKLEDIPEIVRENLEFFSEVQRLHDSSYYWEKGNKLSGAGKIYLKLICANNGIDYDIYYPFN